VKVFVLLADKGNPAAPTGVNLLNAGWTVAPLRIVGAPPAQILATGPIAVVVFIDAELAECNRQHQVQIELVDQDGAVQVPGPAGTQPMRVQLPVMIVTQPGAPTGFPGRANIMFELAQGLPLAPGVYKWQISIDGRTEPDWSASFLVPQPPTQPEAVRFGDQAPPQTPA
jgi:hypothetical protein